MQASSAQPLPLGSNVAVSQTPAGNLAITLQQAMSANVAALTRLDTTQMPVGTLLQAKVLTTQMLPQGTAQPAIYRSLVSVLNNALAGTTLTLESPQPLGVGSLLSAVVQNAQTLNFVPLSGLKDQLAVAQQLATQQSRQGSLDAVFSALQNLPRGDSTSAELRAAAERLLAALPDLAQVSNPKVLAQVVQNSGAFLEAKLLAGQNPQIPPLDMKGALLRLVADLLPALPASTNLNAILAANTLAQVLPHFVRSPLNTLGQVGARQIPAGFPLPERLMANWEGEGDLENLLRLAAGRSRACRAINCRAWNRPAPPPTAACKRPGSWKSPCALCKTSCRCRSSSSARSPRQTRTSPSARIKKTRNKCSGASNWPSTWSRWAVASSAQLSQGKTVQPAVGQPPVHRQPDRKPLGQPARAPGVIRAQRRRPGLPSGHPATRTKTGLEQRWVDETA